MADLVTNALRRKLALAEQNGDEARAERIRQRLTGPTSAPQPAAEEVTPDPASPARRPRGRPRRVVPDALPADEPQQLTSPAAAWPTDVESIWPSQTTE